MAFDHNLYYAAKVADDNWQAALESAYGEQAGNARYDDRGIATPELLAFNQAKKASDIKWHSELHGERIFNR